MNAKNENYGKEKTLYIEVADITVVVWNPGTDASKLIYKLQRCKLQSISRIVTLHEKRCQLKEVR